MTIKRHSRPGRKKRSHAESEQIRKVRERLRRWSMDRGYTHEALANRLGLSRTTVTGWFSKKPTAPSIDHLLTLARRERLNLNWLLLGVGAAHLDSLPEGPLIALYLNVRERLRLPRRVPPERLDFFLPGPEEMLEELASVYQRAFRAEWISFLEPGDGIEFEEMWHKKKVASVQRLRVRIQKFLNRQASR